LAKCIIYAIFAWIYIFRVEFLYWNTDKPIWIIKTHKLNCWHWSISRFAYMNYAFSGTQRTNEMPCFWVSTLCLSFCFPNQVFVLLDNFKSLLEIKHTLNHIYHLYLYQQTGLSLPANSNSNSSILSLSSLILL